MPEKDVNITIRHRKKAAPAVARTNFAPVNLSSRAGLTNLRVADLRSLVRQHNLHNVIKGYSTMKKDAIITAFLKHRKGSTIKIKKIKK